jgi:hypothetical protein
MFSPNQDKKNSIFISMKDLGRNYMSLFGLVGLVARGMYVYHNLDLH